MKTFAAISVLLAPIAPVAAQATTPAPSTTTSTAALTLDSSIEALMADSYARTVVLASLPDIEAAPGYDQFKVISLRKLQPHAGGQITEEHLNAIEKGLQARP